MRFLLDTNILLAYVRLGALGQYLKAVYNLYALRPAPLISIVTEGEIRAIALKNGWGATKLGELQRLLDALTVVPLPFSTVVDVYARIDNYCERHGFVLGKNDWWIAATAHVTGTTLLTTDRDFDPLHGLFLQREWVDPNRRL